MASTKSDSRVTALTTLSLQVNDLRSQKTPIESLFIEATERFRSNIKTMYSVPVRGGPTPAVHASLSPTP